MGVYKTRASANLAAKQMNEVNFTPKSILNIGVGPSHAEKRVWMRDFPEATLFGIDIRGKRRWLSGSKNAVFVSALVSNEEKEGLFCPICLSVKCDKQEHDPTRRYAFMTTIDNIIDQHSGSLEPPYFMWLDIEGSELDAFRGAPKTLEKTVMINLEMREFSWTNNQYCSQLHSFLTDNGFELVVEREGLEDKVYQRVDWKSD